MKHAVDLQVSICSGQIAACGPAASCARAVRGQNGPLVTKNVRNQSISGQLAVN